MTNITFLLRSSIRKICRYCYALHHIEMRSSSKDHRPIIRNMTCWEINFIQYPDGPVSAPSSYHILNRLIIQKALQICSAQIVFSGNR